MSAVLQETEQRSLLPPRELTIKQKLFVDHYLKTRNGTEAARLAGYAGDDPTLAAVAYENLRKPQIRFEIDRQLDAYILTANEVLEGLTRHAQGSLADVLNEDGEFDFKAAKRLGKDKLLKKLKVKKRTIHSEDGSDETVVEHEYEIHDAQAALVHLGKYHKLFGERNESVSLNIDIDASDLAQILQSALSAGAIDVEGQVAEGENVRFTDGTV